MSFVHLHAHSEFSLSSSLLKIDELVRRAASFGMPAVALTDWGNLYGSLYFLKAAKSSTPKVKPIFGVELGVSVPQSSALRHLVLLATNNESYQRLSRLVTRAHVEFGMKDGVLRPHVPLSLLEEYSDGLIALTAGWKGVVSASLLSDQAREAEEHLDFLLKTFSQERLYVELQASTHSLGHSLNERLVDLARRKGAQLVATSDIHYGDAEDAFAQEVWMMVERKLTLEGNPSSKLTPREAFFRSPEDMRDLFSHIPEACDNTLKIAEQCDVSFSFKDEEGRRIYHLPDFGAQGESQEKLFARLALEGLQKRLEKVKNLTDDLKKQYDERLVFEVATIQQMGFAGYYLIVSDYIRWAKARGIPVGPGRGSGAGSLAAYALDIIDLDPIEHGLLFERFLNPERVSLPDFDVDFCQERRDEVIRYVSERFGADRVCQIITYAKEQSKNALKDVGRVLGMSFGETNRLTKLIPSVMAKPLTIQETLNEVAEFRTLVQEDARVKQCVDLAIRLEGALRQPGVHAAGVIIASKPVAEIAPMTVDVDGHSIVQWDMKSAEEAGLVKFDFLGLVTLDLMDLACRLIRKRNEPEAKVLEYSTIPIYDPRAYELIARGQTMGVFQLESSGMQNLCTRLKPTLFSDIAAINALFRPGPLQSGMVDDFINRKHGRAKVEVIFPEMEGILKETYGVIIYQEQVMEIARAIGGYTLGGADLLRRAMGKKNAKEMDAQRSSFVDGAVARGKDPAKAAELFDLIEKFAGYGFNKSHAAAYAALSVQTAFLKAVYPTEFFTALLTIEKEDTERLSRYIADARSLGLKVLPPDINQSELDFSIVEEGTVRFGLSAIKNVGEIAVQGILEARKTGGPFKDLFDLVERVDLSKVNKRVLEALVQAGAFDSLGEDVRELRGTYIAGIEKALSWAGSENDAAERGQFSLFDMAGPVETGTKFRPLLEKPAECPSTRQCLDWEKALLGIYLSGSPLDKYASRIRAAKAVPIFALSEMAVKSVATIAATVQEVREVRVKKGRRAGEMMGIVKLEDQSAQVELISFPDHFKEFQSLFKSGQPLLIRAELDFEEEKPKLLAGQIQVQGRLSVEALSEVEEKWPKKLSVEVSLSKIEGAVSVEYLFSEMAKVIARNRGPVPVELKIQKNGLFQTAMELGPEFAVQPSDELLRDLTNLIAIPGSLAVHTIN